MADSLDVGSIANAILVDAKGLLEAKAQGFLDTHPAAVVLLTKAATQMAGSMVELALTSDAAEKSDIRDSINDDKDALKEEGYSIVVDVEATTKSLFLTILEDAGRMALGLAPFVLKAITI